MSKLSSSKRRQFEGAALAVIPAVLFGLIVVSAASGTLRIPFGDVMGAMLGADAEYRSVIMNLRLPRIWVAAMVGAALAAGGVLMQAVFRNPLAAPDVMGVNGGASAAAVAFLTFFSGAVSIHWLPVVSVAGALIIAAFIYTFSWKRGASPFRMMLVGIGLSTAMMALTTFLLISGPAHLASQVLNWLSGTVYGSNKEQAAILLPWLAVLLPLAWGMARHADVMALGDPTALGLGSPVSRARLLLLFYGVALSGAAVGLAGNIGFVGLMAPHIARLIVGARHRRLIPAAAMLGAILVVLADLGGRLLLSPLDLPAGIFTAAFGAPFFLFLLFRKRSF